MHDVGNTIQVLAGSVELAQGFILADLELQYPGGFFNPYTAILRLGGNHFLNLALLNDGQHLGADADVEKQIGDVFQAAWNLVDIKFAIAGTVETTGDFDFLRQVGNTGDPQAFRHIAQGQGNFGAVDRLAGRGAVEDQIGDTGAAQGFGTLLANDPADGIRNIAFAAPVGADDGGESVGEIEAGGIDEGFETGEFELFEDHGNSSRPLKKNRLRQNHNCPQIITSRIGCKGIFIQFVG